jgi:D-tyrosyl-tRNA(Tyr) deacylase
MARKIAKLRIIPDENFKLNLDLSQVNGSILLISQFTLCADTESNRPSYSQAAPHDQAIKILDIIKHELEATYHLPVATGKFGAHMEVEYKNQGPITIYLEI